MRADLLQLAAELARRGEPFVLALVVRREPLSSAQPGNAALVTAAGRFHGWLGGSCIQPTIVREAAAALADGRPLLVSLSPEPDRDRRPGVSVQPMLCHSGGTVDVYLEPVLPPPTLVVFGTAPTARAASRLGKAMGWVVEAIDPDADGAAFPEADRVLPDVDDVLRARRERAGTIYAVVATMGQRDEAALLAALALDPAYVGVVASRRRFADVREAVAGRCAPLVLERVHNPAGLDLGATTPEEIAVSIVAEIVRTRRTEAAHRPAAAPAAETAIDPVCGMTVAIAGARHTAEHAGRTWFFCNPRCRERFLAAPELHAVAGAAP
jgi:xanthine dehydrogenase accessory factor